MRIPSSKRAAFGGAFFAAVRIKRAIRCFCLPIAIAAATSNALAQKIYGLNFGPFVDGRDPSRGASVTEAELHDHLQILAPRTEWIRTYSQSGGLEFAGSIAHSLGLKAAIGIWLSRDATANEREITRGIATANGGGADLLIVGSEALLRGDLTADQLVAVMRRVRAAVPASVLVTTADWPEFWLSNPSLLAASDVVFFNCYPYWRGVQLEQAMATFHHAYRQLLAFVGTKSVIVSETGWPSAGNTNGRAVATEANAAAYFRSFVSWARANNARYFYFEYADEPWKRTAEGEQGAHWGLWDNRGQLKPDRPAVFDGATAPDTWTITPPIFELHHVPRYRDPGGSVTGFALGLPPNAYQILAYLRVASAWWMKPTLAQPATPIGADGVWTADLTTGGIDDQATQYSFFLVPATYPAPTILGSSTLPADLASYPRFDVTRLLEGGAIAPPIPSGLRNLVVTPGTTASFSVTTNGTPPVTFQWRKNGANIAGATNATLTLPNVSVTDGGAYSVIASNGYGSVTSGPAVLVVSVLTSLGIAFSPASQSVLEEAKVVLGVTTFGDPNPRYQWRRNGVGIVGATDRSLTFSSIPASAAGNYDVVVSNAQGSTTSAAATIAVTPRPPNNAFANRALMAGSSVSATGNSTLATKESGEPDHAGVAGGSSIWWTWTPRDYGNVTIDTIGSAFDTVLAIYTGGAIDKLTLVASDNNAGGNGASRLSFFAMAGTTYHLAVDGVSAVNGRVVLNLRQTLQIAPLILTQPQSVTATAGEKLTLSVQAVGAAPLRYEWRRNGAVVAGATEATLTLSNAQVSDAGSYVAVIANASGTVTSSAVLVAVIPLESRIVNLSARGMIPQRGALVAGFVIRGGSKQVLLRAVGPTLSSFGVVSTLPNPRFEIIPQGGATPTFQNDDWESSPALSNAFSALGAFPLVSRLEAAALATLPANQAVYTVRATGAPQDSGVVLLEIYDAEGMALPAKLINISTLGFVGTGQNTLVCGFAIKGNIAKTLLVRAIGPTLAPYNVGNLLLDPQISIMAQGSTASLASNDDWGGTTMLRDAMVRAGAFTIPDASKDAAVVVTLLPGSYTVVVSGVGGATGNALVEAYDLTP